MSMITGYYTVLTGLTVYSFYRENINIYTLVSHSMLSEDDYVYYYMDGNDKNLLVKVRNNKAKIVDKNTGQVISDICPLREGYIINDSIAVRFEDKNDCVIYCDNMEIARIKRTSSYIERGEEFKDCVINVEGKLPEDLTVAICYVAFTEFQKYKWNRIVSSDNSEDTLELIPKEKNNNSPWKVAFFSLVSILLIITTLFVLRPNYEEKIVGEWRKQEGVYGNAVSSWEFWSDGSVRMSGVYGTYEIEGNKLIVHIISALAGNYFEEFKIRFKGNVMYLENEDGEFPYIRDDEEYAYGNHTIKVAIT